jgi:hypothetical protein
MKSKVILLLCAVSIMVSSCAIKQEGKHLFILSGQSNMAGLDPDVSFTPAVEKAFGRNSVIVVKDAVGGMPIRRWYKNWKPRTGEKPDTPTDLYDNLMAKVYAAIENEQIATVTFIWMQGERDAREELGDVYETSLKGLYNQLSNDLDREDLNYIIGRLSDFDMLNEKYPHWTMIREIQVQVAESDPRFDWVNTDDLNDGVNSRGDEIENDLHMSVQGYAMLGKRFAEKSIKIIENAK